MIAACGCVYAHAKIAEKDLTRVPTQPQAGKCEGGGFSGARLRSDDNWVDHAELDDTWTQQTALVRHAGLGETVQFLLPNTFAH